MNGRVFLLAACILAAASQARPAVAEGRDCAMVSADIATARAAGKAPEAGAFYREAEKLTPPCEPKILFCLGRSVALAHVEMAYDALDKHKSDEAAKLLEAGHAFGEPWPLMVALGDNATTQARSQHDPKVWSDASVAYQKAYSALGEPPLCAGEPSTPAAADMDRIVEKLSVATLLAKPLVFFHSKCAPCNLVFLTRATVDSKKPRVLPITFEDGNGTLTSEGQQTLTAFADCVLAQKWSAIGLSAHTDERGTQSFNLRLSKQRLDGVAKFLADKGYKGRFDGVPKGKSEPMTVDDRAQLLPAEARLLERRIELRGVTGEQQAACFGPDAPKP